MAAALAVLALLAASPGHAQRAAKPNTFESLSGAWSGTGTVHTSDGLHERLRCKANYVVPAGGNKVELTLVCASDAYKFELSSTIVQSGDSLSGYWSERTHRVGGRIVGRMNGGQIEARAEGDTFAALLTVGTHGSRQSFLMDSPGGKVSQVSIALARQGQ